MPADRSPLIQVLRRPPERQPAEVPFAWPAVAGRLRALAEARGRRPDELCELCGAGLEEPHGHLVDVAVRSLVCVCRPCYLLFTHDGAGGARFRAVPDRYVRVESFQAAREAWQALEIPIGLAFFFRNSAIGRIAAFYPSRAGATESELPLEAWDAIARAVPAVNGMAPDVEALLVRQQPPPRGDIEALIVPIDVCYELVGQIRLRWRGISGGDDVWREVDEFVAYALERSRGNASNGVGPR